MTNLDQSERLVRARDELIKKLKAIHPECVTPRNWAALRNDVIRALDTQSELITEITEQIRILTKRMDSLRRRVQVLDKVGRRDSTARK